MSFYANGLAPHEQRPEATPATRTGNWVAIDCRIAQLGRLGGCIARSPLLRRFEHFCNGLNSISLVARDNRSTPLLNLRPLGVAAQRGRQMITWKGVYRHYNHLMDIAFWVLLFAYTRGLLSLTDLPREYLLMQWRPLSLALGILFLLTQVVLIILIMARSLRDEYAERLWQKSAASFVNLLPLFPVLWIGAIFIFADNGGWLDWLRANPNETILPAYMKLSNHSRSIGIYQFEGLSFFVLKLTQYFPLVFAAIYKWHRWRDER